MINFNFGKKKPDTKQIIVLSIVISTIIAALSQCTGTSEDRLWDLLDEITRKYPSVLQELILRDPKKVERRVKRDVGHALDEAIPDYNRFIEEENKKYKPKYVEKAPDGSEAQKLLGGEIRICAIWVDDCPKE